LASPRSESAPLKADRRPGPTQLPARRQAIPRTRGTDPEPAVPAWAHGTDGVGPALLSPRRRAGPVAADGRLRIRHPRRPGPPALAGRPPGVNEWRPQTWR